jgi:predicted phage-related endonuclease
MTKKEIIAQIELMNEWERVIEEAKAEVEAIKDSIKAEMADRDLDELEAGSYIVRYKTVATSRFDSTSFKKTYEDLYKAFLKQTTSRRFSISY